MNPSRHKRCIKGAYRPFVVHLSCFEKMMASNEFIYAVLLVFSLSVVSTIAFWIAVISVCWFCKCPLCYEEWNPDDFN
ncbi:hypothetical protein L596_024157 [Steinernema carpocapsae]|uniref:Uncharacterized protein n=1 Tax=Steinernema carpocapsae TaxID=34508 RepID=A0A4U5MFW9_STECR|nr:hypothetical protein L596_024157 [Steinernema carpocapsae]